MAEDSNKARSYGSPYKIDQNAADYDELRQFVSRAEPMLGPALAEILSDETRKAQRSLLISSFMALLVALGALHFSGTAKYGGLEFSLNASVLLKALVVVCVYFEILVAIRCFTDWTSYRIKTSMPDLDLDALVIEFFKAAPAKPFSETREYLRMQYEQNWKTVAQPNAAKTDELDEATDGTLLRKEQEQNVRTRVGLRKMQWFTRRLSMVRWSRRARLVWEVVFPLSFGALAIISAARAVVG